MHQAEMRRCLEECDIVGMRRLWAHISPHLPMPEGKDAMLVAMHHARTQTQSLHFKYRAYSHAWLLDNGFPSELPDHLRPKAERVYPRFVEGVGLSVNTKNELLRPITAFVHRAMIDAVEDIYSDNKSPDPQLVRSRIQEVRQTTMRKLVGRLSLLPH